MKKLLVLVVLLTTVFLSNAQAQNGGGAGDPAARMQRYKESIKPKLVEAAKITDAEADKVIDITFSYRQKMRGFKDLSEDDRKKQMGQLQAAQNKEFSAIPLTETQIKAVNDFFEEQRKQNQQRQQNGGGNGNG